MTDRVVFKHGVEGRLPGPQEWVRVDMDYPERAADLRRVGVKAIATCPFGHAGSFVTHTITGGIVNPSYVCRADGCTFHAWVLLLDWNLNPTENP